MTFLEKQVETQDIDAKRVEAIQMAKIVPEPRFPRREQSETTHKMGVKGSLGHLFCFYTYNVNVLWLKVQSLTILSKLENYLEIIYWDSFYPDLAIKTL